jgi:hypothetical protein
MRRSRIREPDSFATIFLPLEKQAIFHVLQINLQSTQKYCVYFYKKIILNPSLIEFFSQLQRNMRSTVVHMLGIWRRS